jgi:GT2 family glycosyltransferase
MISIIIPTLNEERSLPPLLDAIRQQGADHEVIVADGGSQDRTLEISRDSGVRTLVCPPVAAMGSASVPRKLVARCCSSSRG